MVLICERGEDNPCNTWRNVNTQTKQPLLSKEQFTLELGLLLLHFHFFFFCAVYIPIPNPPFSSVESRDEPTLHQYTNPSSSAISVSSSLLFCLYSSFKWANFVIIADLSLCELLNFVGILTNMQTDWFPVEKLSSGEGKIRVWGC